MNGSQHTLCWHVDDVKASHIDPKVNDEFHKWLQEVYGAVKAVTATRGKRHDYLGMTLDYSVPGKVMVDMVDYVKAMIDEYPLDLKKSVSSCANADLFKDKEGDKLESLKAECLHTFVAKALFLMKRARPDLQTAVSYLCTRVRSSDVYDWYKLTRMMQFLFDTQDDVLTLESDGSRVHKWSVDAAYAVHANRRSHSGFTLTLGKGAVYASSRKQKQVTLSSTEAEVVAVGDALRHILWTKHFMEAQGYPPSKVLILQDNESAIKLETNGWKSAGQWSKHIDIRYFFVTQHVEDGDVEIEYCPTADMESDYLTKPLQGAAEVRH